MPPDLTPDPCREAFEASYFEGCRPDAPGRLRDENGYLHFAVRSAFNEWQKAWQASAAARMGAASEAWQPIETAPKDKTLLLGYFNDHGKWRTTRGAWMDQDYIDEFAEEPERMSPGWYETTVEDDEGKCWRIEPTHYMPLPPAPSTSKEATDA